MADICPYTCILEDCPKPDRLYVTRNEWTRHVEKDHQQCWQCTACTAPDRPPLIFPSIDGLLGHLRQIHGATISENQHSTLVEEGVRPVPPGISSCPLCESTGQSDSLELLDHIAEHLHAFSLRSLPWTTSRDEEDNDRDAGDSYFHDGDYFDQGSDDQSCVDDPNDSDQDTDGLASLASYNSVASQGSAASATSIDNPPGASTPEETQPDGAHPTKNLLQVRGLHTYARKDDDLCIKIFDEEIDSYYADVTMRIEERFKLYSDGGLCHGQQVLELLTSILELVLAVLSA
ncbi:protein phosphatase [Colletotrichum plurivorum]|uniref:Protein phosphatase n=1 Tax=Colletotrichum plurivorum TaxID=2175906 RepID=A0A8H6NAD4_9PEZI|nr:protein phosphatase [Colletotrichum plurivorum]